MVDLKKLIGGFLILAAITGSLVFVFFDSAPTTKPATADLGGQTGSGAPGNAFLGGASSAGFNANGAAALAGSQVPPTDQSNMTDSLASALASEIIKANPQGPQEVNGEQEAVLPNDAKLTAAATGNLANFVKNAGNQMPDFDNPVPDSYVNISAKNDIESILDYLNSLNKILGNTIAGKNLDDIFRQDPSMDNLIYAQSVYDASINAVKSLSVPSPMAGVHKSILAILLNRKKFLDIGGISQTDPLKALAVVQGTADKIDYILSRDEENYTSELLKINLRKISGAGNGDWLIGSLIKIFSVEKAEALNYPSGPGFFNPFGLSVPVDCGGQNCNMYYRFTSAQQAFINRNTMGTWLRMIWEWLKLYLTEQLKQLLINLIQQKILAFIQGKGVPLFLQNWLGMLTSVYANKAQATLRGVIAPQLCPSFGPAVMAELRSIFGASVPLATGGGYCPLARTTPGSWEEFEATMLPSGNYYGSLLAAASIVNQNALAAQKAAEDKYIASNGYKGKEVCQDGSDPNGTRAVCLDSNDVSYYPNPDGSCDAGLFPATVSNNGLCADGHEPIVTSPGKTTADIATIGLKAQLDRIVNAQNLWGLLTSFVTSLLMQLIQAGINGFIGLTNVGSTSGSLTSASACSGLTGQALTNCQNNVTAINQISASSSALDRLPQTPDNTSATTTNPAATTCGPESQTITIGSAATLYASGGDGQYLWSAPGGSPASSTDPIFYVTYNAFGTYNVTLASAGATSTCSVLVGL